ncbi:MAG TPA: hypothetical protein VGO27_09120 [Candidatus Acidoferrum sp.]|jgi:hypothetical protein|nr:hypothetical protein [Candidatus Acidoferrum sp.]
MAIAISGQYVFRPPIRKGSVRESSRLVGTICPDATFGKVFVPTTGEGFTHQELCEIAEFVRKMAFSGVRRERKAARRG